MRIEEVDPFDVAGYDEWYDAYAAATLHDRGPEADPWSREESRSELRQESAVVRRTAYVARVGEEVVGAAFLGAPLKDNLHRASLGVFVRPESRCRGVGTALLGRLTDEARALGRTVLGSDTWWPYDGGADGAGHPGPEFLRRRGFDLVLADVRRRLALPVDDGRLAALAGEAATRHAAYTLRSWVGTVPDDLVAGWAALDATLETEAPTGDLDLESRTAEVASVRESEELIARQGRTSFHSVALDGAGTVVGYTHLVVSGDDGNAYQWGTPGADGRPGPPARPGAQGRQPPAAAA